MLSATVRAWNRTTEILSSVLIQLKSYHCEVTELKVLSNSYHVYFRKIPHMAVKLWESTWPHHHLHHGGVGAQPSVVIPLQSVVFLGSSSPQFPDVQSVWSVPAARGMRPPPLRSGCLRGWGSESSSTLEFNHSYKEVQVQAKTTYIYWVQIINKLVRSYKRQIN